MPPLQAACISLVFAVLGDPVDVQVPYRDQLLLLSEETRRLMLGDTNGRNGYTSFGKKAMPWLNRALLLTKPGSEGQAAVMWQIERLVASGNGRGCLPVLCLLRADDVRNNRPHSYLDRLIGQLER